MNRRNQLIQTHIHLLLFIYRLLDLVIPGLLRYQCWCFGGMAAVESTAQEPQPPLGTTAGGLAAAVSKVQNCCVHLSQSQMHCHAALLLSPVSCSIILRCTVKVKVVSLGLPLEIQWVLSLHLSTKFVCSGLFPQTRAPEAICNWLVTLFLTRILPDTPTEEMLKNSALSSHSHGCLFTSPVHQWATSTVYSSWTSASSTCSTSFAGESRGFVHFTYLDINNHLAQQAIFHGRFLK